jgi:hypothetical protein
VTAQPSPGFQRASVAAASFWPVVSFEASTAAFVIDAVISLQRTGGKGCCKNSTLLSELFGREYRFRRASVVVPSFGLTRMDG